jgi:hypothetical protein
MSAVALTLVAAVQASHALLIRAACVDKAVALIALGSCPERERLWSGMESIEGSEWVAPDGSILAGPAMHAEIILTPGVDLDEVHAARRLFDRVGHYHRPDIFRLGVDVAPRPPFTRSDGAVGAPLSPVLVDVVFEASRRHLQPGSPT